MISAGNDTMLTVIVPFGAIYQPISVTNFVIDLTGFSEKPFITTFT
jgi:hypothetical protein